MSEPQVDQSNAQAAGQTGAPDGRDAAYYAAARRLGENWVESLSICGLNPHAAAIAASHVISISLTHLSAHNAEAAQALIDELAAGLLKFSEALRGEGMQQ